MSIKRIRSIMFTVIAAMATFGCASLGSSAGTPAAEISIDQRGAGSTVALRLGQRLTISLPGNPTTGFMCEIVPGAEAVLAQQGDPDFQRESSALGAGGIYRFAFQAVGVGSAPLKMIYHRRFESGVPPARSFEVEVVVTK
jgi:inhibitor of cysteine peptidase